MPAQTVEKTISLPKRHMAQETIVTQAARFNVLNCGRRFGKDVLGIDLLIEASLDGYPTAWFSPTYKNMTDVWRVLVDTLEPITKRRSEQEHRLELVNRAVIDLWSLEQPDVARGKAYKRVIINEAAMANNLKQAWELVIRPTLTDYKGDGWFLSTPRGFNYFKTLYDRGQDEGYPEWRSWTYPTEANPYIDPAEIEAARLVLPESVFAQEYLAAFISDATSVFRKLLGAAVLKPTPPIKGHQYVMGMDLAKMSDFSVVSVLDVTDKKQVWIDRSNKVEYVLQVRRLKALCERYKPALIVCERNSMGQAVIELIQRAKLPVYGWITTQGTKQRMIEDLVLAFEQEQLQILDDPTQLAELQAFKSDRTSSGLMKYGAPSGVHDDLVMALALAWQACKSPNRMRVKHREFLWST